jgi:hypothetical protein
MIDNTTNDWIAIKGQESNGWTAIQFKRLLDTCDSMDYPIKVLFHLNRFRKSFGIDLHSTENNIKIDFSDKLSDR